jgi:hypothetical protein
VTSYSSRWALEEQFKRSKISLIAAKESGLLCWNHAKICGLTKTDGSCMLLVLPWLIAGVGALGQLHFLACLPLLIHLL